MFKLIKLYLVLLIGFVGFAVANEKIIKSAELLFKAQVKDIDVDLSYGLNNSPAPFDAFSAIQVKLLDYQTLTGETLTEDFVRFLKINQEDLRFQFEELLLRNDPNSYRKDWFNTLSSYRNSSGGVRGEVIVTGKLKITMAELMVANGVSGIKKEIVFNLIIDLSTQTESQRFTIEGTWKVLSQKSVSIPFTANLIQAYRAKRQYGYMMYVTPNYQLCYHSMVLELSSWNKTGDTHIDNWLSAHGANFKTTVNDLWQHSDLYEKLNAYEHSTKQPFKGNVKVTGQLAIDRYTLENGRIVFEPEVTLNFVEGPLHVINKYSEKVLVHAQITKIYEQLDLPEETPSVKVELNARLQRTLVPKLSGEFEKYLSENILSASKTYTLKYFGLAINAIKAHKVSSVSNLVRGKLEVLFDVMYVRKTLSDGSVSIEYIPNLVAVKGPLAEVHPFKFSKGNAQKIINFHTLYENES